MENSVIWILVCIVVAVVLIWYIRTHFKSPKYGSLCVTTGGLKTGKSTFSLHLAIKTYKRNLRVVKFRNFFNKLFSRELEEEPLFYSTIPVGIPHVPLTVDMITRKVRFRYKSVVWIDEATLLADSQLWKNELFNAQLLEFCKLFGHETKGGCLFFTSHCLSELHMAMRRAASEYFYVHCLFKWLPFFMICTIREERFSEDGTSVNVYNEDVEDCLRKVIVPKKVWKLFDCYCYSILTDNLPVADGVIVADTLKASEVVSFNPLHRWKKKKNDFIDKGVSNDDDGRL